MNQLKNAMAALSIAILMGCGAAVTKPQIIASGQKVHVLISLASSPGTDYRSQVTSFGGELYCNGELIDTPWPGGIEVTSLTYNNLPVGSCTLTADAYGSSGVLFHGSVTFSVESKVFDTTIVLVMNQVPPGDTVSVLAPYISGMTIDDGAPAIGQTVHFSATVGNDSVDTTYLWTQTCDELPPHFLNVLGPTPTAKTESMLVGCNGVTHLTFTATKPNGSSNLIASATLSFTSSPQGGEIGISYNTAPNILSITTSDNTNVLYGGSLDIVAVAADPDGDGITPSWASSCGGDFSPPGSFSTTWTAPASGEGPVACVLTLTVTDSRGLHTDGTFSVEVQ